MRFRNLWQQLGPGILMAGAAIGVSHLVQSTRAGADFGWQLVGLVIFINLIKYPFFEFGHRYAIATGESLLDGYLKLGKPWLILFLVLNAFSGVCAVAGVTFVTAALLEGLLGFGWNGALWSLLLMCGCILIAGIGHYDGLDKVIKPMMAVLFVATVVAFIFALGRGNPYDSSELVPAVSPWTAASLAFLVALMGWMPGPIELSVWQSLWIQAKAKTTGQRMNTKQGKLDFNIGYFMTLILAVLFLGLGALVMYGSGESFSNKGAVFSTQLVELYTQSIGHWSGPLIAIAATFAMFSTTLTVIDAYPRSLAVGLHLAVPRRVSQSRGVYLSLLVVCCALALLIIFSFLNRLKDLVDLVTTVSFLGAPVFAWLNYQLVTSRHLSQTDQPQTIMRVFCLAALLFLVGISVLYLYTRFFS